MPTYDYRCKACGDAFEHFQSISSPLLRKCSKCGKPALERLIGAGAGLLFKGSGFYITDYRNSSYRDAAKKDAPPSAADSKSGSGKDAAPSGSGSGDAAKKSGDAATPAPAKKTADAPSKSSAPKSSTSKSPSSKGDRKS